MAMLRFGKLLCFGKSGLAIAGSLLAFSGAVLADGPGYSIKDTAPEVFRWAGPYVGANIGYDATRSRQVGTPTGSFFGSRVVGGAVVPGCGVTGACPFTFADRHSGTGVTGGVQAGYNWQASSFVYGVEGDLVGTTAGTRHDEDFPVSPGFSAFHGAEKTNVTWLSTIRARLGYLVTSRSLVYATGGFAFGGVERSYGGSFSNGDIYTGRAGSIDTGFAYGAGYELALDLKSTLGIEYLHVSLDGGNRYVTSSQSGGCIVATQPTCSVSVKGGNVENDIFRLKYNYKF